MPFMDDGSNAGDREKHIRFFFDLLAQEVLLLIIIQIVWNFDFRVDLNGIGYRSKYLNFHLNINLKIR